MRDLVVLALGGHALGVPAAGSYAEERERISALAGTFERLAASGSRLLLVHGNGPQVGYLADRAGSLTELDLHVAQTQGELGYLLASALPAPNVCVMTRVRVPDDAGPPVKPIGPYLAEQHPVLPSERFPDGWRVVVPSPRPEAVVELEAVREALAEHHVVAGGGGGIPIDGAARPVMAVVDKDWVALELALALDASALLFVTNVDHVYRRYGHTDAEPLDLLDTAACDGLLASDELGAGSMHPKLAAASAYVAMTGRRSAIGLPSEIERMLAGRAGTRIVVGP